MKKKPYTREEIGIRMSFTFFDTSTKLQTPVMKKENAETVSDIFGELK